MDVVAPKTINEYVGGDELIPQRVFIKLFCENHFPHISVNVSFIITYIKNKLMDMCGN